MKLLYTKRSPYARKVRVFALEKGIKLDLIEEDLVNKSSQLVSANPLGKIPTLILEDGTSLCDSPVICEYLETFNPAPQLIPSGQEKFKVLHIAAIADGIMDTSIALYMEKMRHSKDPHEAYLKTLETSIYNSFKFLEDHLKSLSAFNLASIAVASAIGYLIFRLPQMDPKEKFPQLSSWYEQFLARPSMKETMPVA